MDIKDVRRAACYVRVSTTNQIENYSIGEQTKRTEAYCKARGWSVCKVYSDGGYSGGDIKRPALEQMLEDMQQHKFDVVVVFKLDRLSRSQKDTLTLIEDKFANAKIDFASATENLDTTTPLGKAMIGIISVFAQLEKDQITERFMTGRVARTRDGRYHGGKPEPIGYDYIDGYLVINEHKAMQVREVFDRFLTGQAVYAIHQDMRKKYGGWPGHSSVLNALRNTVYIGKVKFQGVEYDGVHEPIVSKDKFNKANTLLSQRADKHTTVQKNPFRASQLLISFMYCGKCGARYSSARGRYKCYSRSKVYSRFVVDPACKNKHWPIDALDSIIVDAIKALRHNPKRIDDIFKDKQQEPTINKSAINKRLKTIKREVSKLIDLYQIGGISIEDIKSRVEVLQQEADSLNTQLTTTVVDIAKMKNDFTSILQEVEAIFNGDSLDEKRLFVGSLIEKITLTDEQVQIDWRI